MVVFDVVVVVVFFLRPTCLRSGVESALWKLCYKNWVTDRKERKKKLDFLLKAKHNQNEQIEGERKRAKNNLLVCVSFRVCVCKLEKLKPKLSFTIIPP